MTQRSSSRGKFSKRGKQWAFNSRGHGFTQSSCIIHSDSFDLSTPAKLTTQTFHKGHANGVTCQICGKPNHFAIRCHQRFNQTYQPEMAFAALSLSDGQDHAWFLDTVASHHMTFDCGKLTSCTPYLGSDKIMVGNGKHLDISHVGNVSLHVGSTALHLDNVLAVPDIKANLL